MIARLKRLCRRAARADEGSATIEVVLLVPLFVTLLLCTVEAGMLMVRHTMVDRAIDITVRDLRLGRYTNPTVAQLRQDICARTVVMPNCMNDLMIEMRPVSRATWALPAGRQPCVDRNLELQPNTTFIPGGENELVLIRVCALFDPLFPTTPYGLRLPLDSSGAYQLLAMSSFVNEPR